MNLLYLHGFASAPTSGKAQYFRRRFAERGVQMQIPQLDAGDFEHLTITGQLQVVEQAVGGQSCVLMGSSMGGYLAALYASLHPETTQLVLLAPAFYFPVRWPESLGPDRTSDWKQKGSMDVFHYGEGKLRSLSYGLIEDALSFAPAPDFQQPALVFHGIRDVIVPIAYSEEYAATHPNVILRRLDSDHSLTDQVERIWEESAEFLSL